MKENLKIAKLLFHYIRHELLPGQEKELNEWRSSSAENETFFQQETSLDHIRSRLQSHEESKVRIKDRLQANYPPNWTEGAPRKTGIVIRMLRNAAIFIGSLIILGGGYVAYQLFLNPATPKNFAMMANMNGELIMMNDFQMGWYAGIRNIKATRKGNGELLYTMPDNQKAKGQSDTLWTSNRWRFELRFTDGSDIWMNLSSRIGYPQNINYSDSVSYSMLGEAFFKIPGNTNKHYEIRTDSLLIQTTGARLDVRTDADFVGSTVILVSGTASVKSLYPISDTARPIQLIPGQEVVLTGGKFIVNEHPDIKRIFEWKR